MTITLQERLQLKVEVAADLYRQGRITRAEALRIEIDQTLLKDTGPIQLIQPPKEQK